MKIAVAGATGRLGRHVAEVLTERGHQVVAISRATGAEIQATGGLLPGPGARLAGPTFAEWLDQK
jgi:uncharacterized protein YbjT (DUF2867 family)